MVAAAGLELLSSYIAMAPFAAFMPDITKSPGLTKIMSVFVFVSSLSSIFPVSNRILAMILVSPFCSVFASGASFLSLSTSPSLRIDQLLLILPSLT